MKIVYSDDNLKLNNSVVVLGNFDGVHLGHKMLIEKTVKTAKENNFLSVVYTFSEHPQKIFGKDVEIITTNAEKEKIFSSLGVDVLVYQKPDSEILNLSPEKFFEDIIIKRLSAKYCIVGKHYSFGAKAKGTSDTLKDLGEEYGIEVYIEELLEKDNSVVSSSKIREFLKNADILKANQMLGREFSVTGEVVHGNHIGTGIGFPTANVNFLQDKIVPKYGVYIGKAEICGTEYNAVINIGIKPTVGENAPLLEAHIIDADCDFYGENITLKLYEFLREERKFESLDALKEQITTDLQKAKEYFK